MKKTKVTISFFAALIAAITVATPLFLHAAKAADITETAKTYLTGNGTNAGTNTDGSSRNVGAGDIEKNYSTYTFLDIRLDELYNAGHIAGSYHVVYGEQLAEKIKYLPLDKPIVVVSNDGQLGWQVTGALNTVFAADGIDTKVISWQGGYTTEGIAADKISTEATALPDAANALTDAGLKLFSDYIGGLKNANYPNFIVNEAETWKVINGIYNKKKEFTDKYIVVFLPAFKGTYVGEFNDSILRIDYGGTEGAAKLTGLDKSKIILVACGSGQTSDNVVGSLRVAGFNAYSVANGWGGNKGEITGNTKQGGISAYDAAQVAAGKKALFSENVDTSIRNKKNWIPLVVVGGVVVVAGVVTLIILLNKKKKKAN
ncbi:MAG: rhodanese-like domain-containing protein [Lachnospiraceae bacterium]|nr:rhodanese-like domain-containing protein [Lachnospiraceae bacterium]